MRSRLAVISVLLLLSAFSLVASAAADEAAEPQTPRALETYAQIFGAVVAGLGTLLGLPLVLVTYRKTRAEIVKLELETKAIREKSRSVGNGTEQGSGVQVNLSHSQVGHLQLSDPRMLAPLLVILDFVFAWILLTLARYFLGLFLFELARSLAMAGFAAALFLPIAREVLRLRMVLGPPEFQAAAQGNLRKLRLAIYGGYILAVLSSGTIGVLLLLEDNSGLADSVAGYGFLVVGLLLGISMPFLRSKLKVYLSDFEGAEVANK